MHKHTVVRSSSSITIDTKTCGKHRMISCVAAVDTQSEVLYVQCDRDGRVGKPTQTERHIHNRICTDREREREENRTARRNGKCSQKHTHRQENASYIAKPGFMTHAHMYNANELITKLERMSIG